MVWELCRGAAHRLCLKLWDENGDLDAQWCWRSNTEPSTLSVHQTTPWRLRTHQCPSFISQQSWHDKLSEAQRLGLKNCFLKAGQRTLETISTTSHYCGTQVKSGLPCKVGLQGTGSCILFGTSISIIGPSFGKNKTTAESDKGAN